MSLAFRAIGALSGKARPAGKLLADGPDERTTSTAASAATLHSISDTAATAARDKFAILFLLQRVAAPRPNLAQPLHKVGKRGILILR